MQPKQDQVKKCHSLVLAAHIFNGVNGRPRIVAVVPLSNNVNIWTASVSKLAGALNEDVTDCLEYVSYQCLYFSVKSNSV